MTTTVNTSPIPYLIVRNGSAAIEFYKRAFGATEAMVPVIDPSGRVGHAALKLGELLIFLADEHPELDILSPQSLGGSPVLLVLPVADAGAQFDQAVAAGATVVNPLENKPYGGRAGKIADPYGHVWIISQS